MAPVRSHHMAPRGTLRSSRPRLLLPLPIPTPLKLSLLAWAPACPCLRPHCCWCCCCCQPTGVGTVTGLADKPTRGQSSHGLINSRTSQLAEMFDLKFGLYNSTECYFRQITLLRRFQYLIGLELGLVYKFHDFKKFAVRELTSLQVIQSAIWLIAN